MSFDFEKLVPVYKEFLRNVIAVETPSENKAQIDKLVSFIAAFAEKDGNRILSQDIIEKLEKAYTADEIFDEIGKKYGYRRRENL